MSIETRRNRVVLVVLLLLWGLALGRLAYVQLVRGKHYRARAENQHQDSLRLSPERGLILDRWGRALALNRSECLVYVWPRKVRCLDSLADMLAGAGLGTKSEVRRELVAHERRFSFERRLSRQQADSLWQQTVKQRFGDCTAIETEARRVYPYGPVCANVVGFVGKERGLAGIESWCDSLLRGQPGWVLMQLDGVGHRLPYPSYPRVEPRPGADVSLTLDIDVQQVCHQALVAAAVRTRARAASAVVLSVPSGEVLALANHPTYDPERFAQYHPSRYRCLPACDEFEPGSSFKLVICAAALESQNAAYLMTRTYDVSAGYVEVMGKQIHDAHRHGVLDFDGLFVMSSNPGCALLSLELDRELFFVTARALGFGSRTDIELPGEAVGRLDPPSRLNALRLANVAFGQGVTVSLLQLAAAYLCVANEGQYVRPSLVRLVAGSSGRTYRPAWTRVRRAVSRTTAQRLKEILAKVVAEGTGGMAAMQGAEVCGKTGTAQKVEPTGGYSATRSVMSFVGFFPKERPRYVIAVIVDEPQTERFASTAACPLFRDIGERLLVLERMRGRGGIGPMGPIGHMLVEREDA